MLHLLNPNLDDVYQNSFGDAVKRVNLGYFSIQDALKNDNCSATRRTRLTTFLNGRYLPRTLVLLQPDDMAEVIAFAQALKEEADTAVAVND